MDSRLPHPRQIQAQLQALGEEIQSIREEHDGHIVGLSQRLQQAENRQRQLLHQLQIATNRFPGPPGSSHSGYSSSTANQDNPLPLSESLIGTGRITTPPRAHTGGATSNDRYDRTRFLSSGEASSRHNSYSSRPSPVQSVDANATPRAQNAAPQLNPVRPQQPVIGSKDNAAYLPMVMENIMSEHRRHKREGTLRSCGFVFPEGRTNDVKCSQDSFHIPCFRANHFYYCRQHMRVIPGGKTVCSHRNKQDCLVVIFEDHDDWDLIVDAALAAGNLGNKGVDVEDLKEALFPPQNYSDRYMSAPG